MEIFNRYVELNPDTQGKSDRPEWCYLRYDDTYKPTEVYEFEFQWMAATASILNELVKIIVYIQCIARFFFQAHVLDNAVCGMLVIQRKFPHNIIS